MDIMHHVRIVWRWRRIALAGCLLAGVLAILVSFKPSTSGLEWRSQATYMSSSRLFVTQPGFPWGRATLPTADAAVPVSPDSEKLKSFAPPSRFNELAVEATIDEAQPASGEGGRDRQTIGAVAIE